MVVVFFGSVGLAEVGEKAYDLCACYSDLLSFSPFFNAINCPDYRLHVLERQSEHSIAQLLIRLEIRPRAFHLPNGGRNNQGKVPRKISLRHHLLSTRHLLVRGSLCDIPGLAGGFFQCGEDVVLGGREGSDVDVFVGSFCGMLEGGNDGLTEGGGSCGAEGVGAGVPDCGHVGGEVVA